MRRTLKGFAGVFRIGRKTMSNLRYVDSTVLNATSPEERQDLICRVEKAAKEYNMVINAAKTKVMTNTITSKALGVLARSDKLKLEQVDAFGYMGSKIINDRDCKRNVKTPVALGMAAMVKLTKCKKQANKHQCKTTTDESLS